MGLSGVGWGWEFKLSGVARSQEGGVVTQGAGLEEEAG